jgi:hypothetical protein
MTRKHFNAIANALRLRIESIHTPTAILREVEAIANALANEFEVINPRFNRDYFLAVALGETD